MVVTSICICTSRHKSIALELTSISMKPMRKMKFENRKEQVAEFPQFVLRLLRYWVFTALVVAFSVCLGMVGYRIWGGLDWLDSFHMACMILTGMGPVVEMTTSSGKLFSSFYALYSGIAFFSVTAILFAPIIHRLLHILHIEVDELKA